MQRWTQLCWMYCFFDLPAYLNIVKDVHHRQTSVKPDCLSELAWAHPLRHVTVFILKTGVVTYKCSDEVLIIYLKHAVVLGSNETHLSESLNNNPFFASSSPEWKQYLRQSGRRQKRLEIYFLLSPLMSLQISFMGRLSAIKYNHVTGLKQNTWQCLAKTPRLRTKTQTTSSKRPKSKNSMSVFSLFCYP